MLNLCMGELNGRERFERHFEFVSKGDVVGFDDSCHVVEVPGRGVQELWVMGYVIETDDS